MSKDDGEDRHGRQRLQDRPGGANRGLLVSQLDVPPNEEVKDFPEFPEADEIQVEQTAARPNDDRRRAACRPRRAGGGIRGYRCRLHASVPYAK